MNSLPSLIGITSLEELSSSPKCDTSIDLPEVSLLETNKYHPQPSVRSKKKSEHPTTRNEFFGSLVGQGLKILNHYHHDRIEEIDAERLVELLLAQYPAVLEAMNPNVVMLSAYDAHMGGDSKTSDLNRWDTAEEQCRNAARSAIDKWDDTYIPNVKQKARDQGARGGRAYCTYTLDDHLATAHLQAKDAAAVLGINIRTVHRMRNRYADLDLDTGELEDAETPHIQSAESVPVRSGARERTRDSTGALGKPDPYAGSGPGAHAALAHQLREMNLPF